MICDWWAFSWARGNLYEIFNWYDEHSKNMKLAPETRTTVESILDKIKNILAQKETAVVVPDDIKVVIDDCNDKESEETL